MLLARDRRKGRRLFLIRIDTQAGFGGNEVVTRHFFCVSCSWFKGSCRFINVIWTARYGRTVAMLRSTSVSTIASKSPGLISPIKSCHGAIHQWTLSVIVHQNQRLVSFAPCLRQRYLGTQLRTVEGTSTAVPTVLTIFNEKAPHLVDAFFAAVCNGPAMGVSAAFL
jgi:hypothetical protein